MVARGQGRGCVGGATLQGSRRECLRGDRMVLHLGCDGVTGRIRSHRMVL